GRDGAVGLELEEPVTIRLLQRDERIARLADRLTQPLERPRSACPRGIHRSQRAGELGGGSRLCARGHGSDPPRRLEAPSSSPAAGPRTSEAGSVATGPSASGRPRAARSKSCCSTRSLRTERLVRV